MSDPRILPLDELTEEQLQEGFQALRAPGNRRTICNIIRELYTRTKKDPKTAALCAEAIYRAKRIVAKLKEYRDAQVVEPPKESQ